MGERDLPAAEGRMFSSRGRLEAGAGWWEEWEEGGVELVKPAVEETVETREGGGEGVTDLEGGAGGGGGGLVAGLTSVFRPGLERVEETESAVLSCTMTPLASMVSLLGVLETTTVLQTASRMKNSLIVAHIGLRFDSVPSTSTWMSRLLRCSASLELTGMTALALLPTL